jgi:hypothetical protein
MAEEVEALVIVQVVSIEGNLQINIPSNDAMLLWGIAKMIEKRADEVHFQAMSMIQSKKSKLVVP